MQTISIIAILSCVSCVAIAYPGGHYADHYAYPKYNYNYGVHSPHTGDVKNQWEARDGDAVKGSYRLNDPDGTIRQVDYTADKHNGFNAIVKKIGKSVHPPAIHHHGHVGHHGGFHAGGSSYVNGFSHAIGHYGAYHY
ncbi:cuticle protein 19-like [Ischnura elegans]|uniref:cuticle protein 19-like n=1 Tax=Ischnura elegans TaxID=197161 RepID=UPI001ED86C80|nr:cuticle protein 19-like [Ischnura elegans]